MLRIPSVLFLAVVVALAVRVPALSVASNLQTSLDWAARLLAEASAPPTKNVVERLPRLQAKRTEQAYSAVIRKYGVDANALTGLARARALMGEYDKAAACYKQALKLSSQNSRIQNELAKVQQQAKIASAAVGELPAGQRVLNVLSYPDAGGRWLVLSAKLGEEPASDSPHALAGDDVYLSLFADTAAGLQKTWHSKRLGADAFSEGEFSDLQFNVVDLTSDGISEVVVTESFVGASWIPSHLDVFTWRKGNMVHLLQVSSHLPLRIIDLNRDGKYEVLNDYAINRQMSHSEQPRWSDIRAYRNGSYRLANELFPEQFRRIQSEIQRTLKKYPKDWELLKYLGITYEIQGERKQALSSYKAAYRNIQLIDLEDYEEDPVGDSADIRKRIQSIEARSK